MDCMHVALLLLYMNVAEAYEFSCPEFCDCQPLLRAISCNNLFISRLPDGIMTDTISLDLSSNEFEEVPNNIGTLSNLVYLDMGHNKISYLTKNTFENNLNLQRLHFSYNKLSWNLIDPQTFEAMTELHYLDISYNKLGDVTGSNVFSSSVSTLDLTNCSMQQIDPVLIENFPNLKILILSLNPIVSIDATLTSPKLMRIDFSGCKMKHISEEAFINLKSLRVLSFANNFELQEFSCRSDTLKELDLSHCALSNPPAIGMRRLEDLLLPGNRLRNLEDDIFAKFPNLSYIDLSQNVINFVGREAFRGLDYLETINLSFNPLHNMDKYTFNTNFRLKKLLLRNTHLANVPDFDIELLEVLDLSEGEIATMSKKSLRKMPFIRTMNLSRNYITAIPDFLESDSLEILDVSLCRVVSINKDTFLNLPSLRTVNLMGNRLTGSFNTSYLYQIDNLFLSDNLWRCDCNTTTFKFFNDYSKSTAIDYGQLKCYYPDNLKGMHWEGACGSYWYDGYNSRDRTWAIGIGLAVALCVIMCIVVFMKRAHKLREEERRHAEELERAEARQRLIQQRLRSQEIIEGENRNAPDPREQQRPPCYDEAIMLPRIDGSTGSLAGSRTSLHSTNEKKQRRNRKRRKPRSKGGSESEQQSSSSTTNKRQVDSDSEPHSLSDVPTHSTEPEIKHSTIPKVYKESNI